MQTGGPQLPEPKVGLEEEGMLNKEDVELNKGDAFWDGARMLILLLTIGQS